MHCVKDMTFYLKKIHDSMHSIGNELLKELDLTFSQMSLLFYLTARRNEVITQKDIERDFDIRHTSVIGLLQRMEKKKLLKTVVNPEDHRSRKVVLLDRAFEIENEMERVREKILDDVRRKMSDEKMEQLKSLLCELYEAITNEKISISKGN